MSSSVLNRDRQPRGGCRSVGVLLLVLLLSKVEICPEVGTAVVCGFGFVAFLCVPCARRPCQGRRVDSYSWYRLAALRAPGRCTTVRIVLYCNTNVIFSFVQHCGHSILLCLACTRQQRCNPVGRFCQVHHEQELPSNEMVYRK